MSTGETEKLAVFEGRRIRKAFREGEWWFSIIDVVEVLVGGDRPRKYWNDLKKKLLQEGYDQLSEKIGQLKMKSSWRAGSRLDKRQVNAAVNEDGKAMVRQ